MAARSPLPDNPFMPSQDRYIGPAQPAQPGQFGGFAKQPSGGQPGGDDPFKPMQTSPSPGGDFGPPPPPGGLFDPPPPPPGGDFGPPPPPGGFFDPPPPPPGHDFGPPPPGNFDPGGGGGGGGLGGEWTNAYFNANPNFAMQDYIRSHGYGPQTVAGRYYEQQGNRLFNEFGALSAQDPTLNYRPWLDSQQGRLSNWEGITEGGLMHRPPRGRI